VKAFVKGFIVLIFLSFYFSVFISLSFADTTSFRSANIVTTSGSPAFDSISLANCSFTDGITCDKPLVSSYANLYFRDFGSYADFGIPSDATITKVKVKMTGKANVGLYVGLSSSITSWANCGFPSDIWTFWDLVGNTIKVKTFTTDVVYSGVVVQAVSGNCFQQYNFDNKKLTFRINYSSSQPWSANIDNLEIAFDYNPPTTPTPTPTPTPSPTPTPTSTPTPTPTPKTPLILIPGIGGSELKINEMKVWAEDTGHGGKFSYLYPKNENVWLNEDKMGEFGEDDYYDVLRMKTDGITSEANIGLTGNLVVRAYQGAIDFFISNGYELNKDFFVFPYDWRKDISGTKSFLDEEIQQIKTQTGSAKVDIVAHSMGGLVARSYISDAARALNVRKLFTLGTPHLGSVSSLKALRYGYCLAIEIGPFCLSLAPSEMKDIVQNMISDYELVPSKAYFNFYSGEDSSHPYPYRTESGSLNYNQIKNLLTGLSYNTLLFNPSEAFHNLDNSLSNTNGVDVTVIAGSGIPTLGQIIEKKTTSLLGIQYVQKDILNINGDKTVPLLSASLIDSDKNKSLLGDAEVFYTNQEHGELAASGSALNLVKNILEGRDQLPDDVLTEPYSFSGTQVSVHSPVNINVYDASDNHTGPTSNGDFETNIPGSTYDTLDDAKFIFLPDDGVYTIKFEATDQGSFDFKIRSYEDNVNTSTVLYNDIPLTVSTKAQTVLDTLSSQPPILQVDQDGNGTIDSNIEPTDENSTPTIAPTTAPTSSSTSTSTSMSTTTSTPTPIPISTLIAKSNDTLIKKEDDNAQTQTTDVKGASDVADKSSGKDKRYVLDIIALSGIVIVLLLSRIVSLPFLKKFWK